MYTSDDYLEQLFALLPPGDAFTRELGTVVAELLGVMADELALVDGALQLAVSDFVPDETTLFLEEWERAMQLPHCGTLAATLAERRKAVVARFSAGGLDAASLEAGALELGFDVTITNSLTTDFQFDVELPVLPVTYFRVGSSRVGEPLNSPAGIDALICFLDENRPAWTTYVLTAP